MPPPPPLPLISLRNATFHRGTQTLFPNTTLTLHRDSKLAVVGPSAPLLLDILAGAHTVTPPTARTYPYLAAHHLPPSTALTRLTFPPAAAASYTSARYESLREPTDLTLAAYLGDPPDTLGLLPPSLLPHPLITLSNGQLRRARLARALARRPAALLLDAPFLGLDPSATTTISRTLAAATPALALALRHHDPIPAWTSTLVYAADNRVLAAGAPADVAATLRRAHGIHLNLTHRADGIVERVWRGVGATPAQPESPAEPVVELRDVTVRYGAAPPVITRFSWRIARGEKWGLFGPNGAGKTTVTSLLTGDHPLSYAVDVRHWGRGRVAARGAPGVPLAALQRRMGVASPELLGTIPGYLTLRRVVCSGFAETPLMPPEMTGEERRYVESVLERFGDCLPEGVTWEERFGEVALETKRLVVFLRAVVARRELVVLDEAFAGMREEVRERCFELMRGEWARERTVVVVSHVSEEVPPGIDRWVRLPESGSGEPAVFGIVE